MGQSAPCDRSVSPRKLHDVRYDVRGPILQEAQRLEAEGHRVLKLNIGNPAPFGFEAPESILVDMIAHLPHAQGYSDSRGIFEARTAVAHFYQEEGLRDVTVDDVFIGNGVSEMISMVLQALVDDGDEILIPAPDYPLWTASVTLSGGRAVHYLCDEDERLDPGPRRHRVADHPAHAGRWSSSTRTTPPAPSTPRRSSRGSWTWPPSTTWSCWPTRSTRRSCTTTPCTPTRRRSPTTSCA